MATKRATAAEAPSPALRLLTTRESILKAPDLARDTVPTPEWGEDSAVRVQALDVNRRLAWLAFISTRELNPDTGRQERAMDPFKPSDAALAALGIIDEEGEPLFSLADIEALGAKHPKPIGRIARVVAELSRISEDVEVTAAGPLGGTTNGVSHSD